MFQIRLFYPATVSLLLGLSFVLACDFASEEISTNGSDVRSHTGSDGEGLESETSDLSDIHVADNGSGDSAEVIQDDPVFTDTSIDLSIHDESDFVPRPDLVLDPTLEAGPFTDGESDDVWSPVDTGPTEDDIWSPVDTGPTEDDIWSPVDTGPTEDDIWSPVDTGPTEDDIWGSVDTGPIEEDLPPIPIGSCYRDGDCSPFQFCDFSNDDCGIWGDYGRCAERPGLCIAGGSGACGCQGAVRTNNCEIQSMGEDVLQYGGCIFSGSRYLCGERDCDPVTQYCSISLNDVVGPAEPEYYANCIDLPAACMLVVDPLASPDCSCLGPTLLDFEVCSDATGYIMVFYPGG
jgi:hypothetical protein